VTNIKSVQLGKRTSETPHMSTNDCDADTLSQESSSGMKVYNGSVIHERQ
jgi:hypothetical protein